MQNSSEITPMSKKKNLLMFLIPSLIGLILFMAPITYNGSITIPVAVLAKSIQVLFGEHLVAIVTGIIMFMSVITILAKIVKPKVIANNAFLFGLLNPSPLWFVVRLVGGIAAAMVYFQFGPEVIWEPNTGGLVLNDLLPVLFSVDRKSVV